MPEGPELRYVKEYLYPNIINKNLISLESLSKTKPKLPNKTNKVLDVNVNGKLLWIKFNDFYLHIHFMIDGWLHINEEPKYTKYIMTFDDNTKIYISSLRKFTFIKVLSYKNHENIIKSMGIDVLTKDFTLEAFTDIVTSYNISVSALLLQQDKICGTGNYIRSDSLYLSKIDPKANTSSLKETDIINLYNSIKYVSISQLVTYLTNNKIKIPKDIKSILPEKYTKNYNFYVYNKEKDRYNNKITKEKIAGRWAYYVKKIQTYK